MGEPVELPPPALLKLLGIIQPAVLTTFAVLVGVWLAGRVGLHRAFLPPKETDIIL